MSIANWPPLESNPSVYNDFAHKSGLPKTWEFSDVYGLDDELLAMVPQPCIALIFLFPSKAKTESVPEKEGKEKCFFIKQIPQLDQACGTIALLHAIANNLDTLGMEEGPILTFIKSVNEQPIASAEECGTLLATNATLSQMHSSFSQEGQTEAQNDSDHHFVCFTAINGHLYEFDGCKAVPVDHGEFGEEDFLHKAASTIKSSYLTDPDVLDFAMISLGKAMDDE